MCVPANLLQTGCQWLAQLNCIRNIDLASKQWSCGGTTCPHMFGENRGNRMRRKTVVGLCAERTVCPHPMGRLPAHSLKLVPLPAHFAITPVTLLRENIRRYSVQCGGSSLARGTHR